MRSRRSSIEGDAEAWDGGRGFDTPLSETSDQQIRNDVAVVGMACRVAGSNDSPEELWQSILDKKDASGEIPQWRWEPYHRRDARNTKALNETTSRGYFLDKLEDFDAAFFGISPKEAEQMDPQQRVSLEVAWEALERAGIPPHSLSGSDTAVFMGVNSDDYSKLLLEDVPNVDAWMGIGTAYCGVPNRISYHLNLMGPSTAVDAACASSLVAIHHGRQSLLAGESKVAIAGGVNALCGPGLTAVLDKAGAISKEGCCRSFDDSANGYGRGEGAAVVILKRLGDAIANGDNILAVLKGSAVAQDGKTNGIMAPNATAQEKVARDALRVGLVPPSSIQYVEAHATSTPLGDPTEVSAIASVYGKERLPESPCYIGSVKPNVGHLEAGAGAVGFIKAILAMNKGIIPPQTNLETVNSKIDWKRNGVQVLQNAVEWPPSTGPRRAAICSYGYGGTVSHAVIEQYQNTGDSQSDSDSINQGNHGPKIFVLSSPREKSLGLQTQLHANWITSHGKLHSIETVASTLATRRHHHEYRAAFVANTLAEAAEAMMKFDGANHQENTFSSRVMASELRNVVWVFSGHGAQWTDMAKILLKDPTFYRTIARFDPVIKTELGFSPLLSLQTGSFSSTDEIQVLTYATQVGLSNVLNAKGLKPQAIIGHSVGEIAASVAAGCLTADEGALIVAKRAKLYRQMMGLGAMILVNLPFTKMQDELTGRSDLCAAIDSSPSSCVVSGKTTAVAELIENLKRRNIKTFTVKTDIAFHSPMLEQLSKPLANELEGLLNPRPPQVPFYSTSVNDTRAAVPHNVAYWINNMVSPVFLNSAVTAAAADGLRLFVEISTHPIISHSVTETLMDSNLEDFSVLPLMTRNKSADDTISGCIAQLFCKGAEINWSKQMSREWCPDVPTTAWSHKPYWKKIETGPLNVDLLHDPNSHTLLGKHISIANEETQIYTTKLDESTKPFPGSHPLHGSEIVPAAGLINTFLHATGTKTLRDITLRVPVAINAPRDVQVVVQRDRVKLCSSLIQDDRPEASETSWVTHTTGMWHSQDATTPPDTANVDIAATRNRIGTQLANNFSIDYLDKVGVSAMGFPWAIDEHFGNLEEMLAHVDVAPHLAPGAELPWDKTSWAPILDAATSVGSTIFFDNPRLRMPAHIDSVEIYTSDSPPRYGYLFVQKDLQIPFASHVAVLSESGKILARFRSMRFSEIEGTPGISGSVESLVHQIAWPPAAYSETPISVKSVLLVSKSDARAHKYTKQLDSKHVTTRRFTDSATLIESLDSDALFTKDCVLVYVPGQADEATDLSAISEHFISEVLDLTKLLVSKAYSTKLFVLTDGVSLGGDYTALAQAPLHGLGRIIASEHPDQWGGLIDTEDEVFPLHVIRYVRERDIVRISDGIPRTAVLRSLPKERLHPVSKIRSLLPKPEGTYLITGGLGALGLEVASFLVEQGARRLILISRTPLPPRAKWEEEPSPATQKIVELEKIGASVYALAIDIGSPDGPAKLEEALQRLNLPRVIGVVHAAGVLEDQLVLDTTAASFQRVLSPKVAGSWALHRMFPPGSVDFFILFSSCGQLFGFPGQSSYASGNAFLDTLATHRRIKGDNAIAFQWTSWRGAGMASSTEFINAELESKGITDITRNEGFRAWQHASKYSIDHAVVLRSLTFEDDEMLPSPLLREIAARKASNKSSEASAPSAAQTVQSMSGPELKSYLDEKIKECVVSVLHLSDSSDVDVHMPLSDMGIDSVMTVSLRKSLQKTLSVVVPPTLTWSYPTVGHLIGWFTTKLQS